MGLENRILVQVVGRNGKQIIEGGVEVDAEVRTLRVLFACFLLDIAR